MHTQIGVTIKVGKYQDSYDQDSYVYDAGLIDEGREVAIDLASRLGYTVKSGAQPSAINFNGKKIQFIFPATKAK